VATTWNMKRHTKVTDIITMTTMDIAKNPIGMAQIGATTMTMGRFVVSGMSTDGTKSGVNGTTIGAGNTTVPFKFYFSDSVLMVWI